MHDWTLQSIAMKPPPHNEDPAAPLRLRQLAREKKALLKKARQKKTQRFWLGFLGLFAVAGFFLYYTGIVDFSSLLKVNYSLVETERNAVSITPKPIQPEPNRKELSSNQGNYFGTDSNDNGVVSRPVLDQRDRSNEVKSNSLARASTAEIKPKKLTAAEKLLAEDPMLLTGMTLAMREAGQRDDAILDRVLNEGTWDAYREFLQKSLRESLPPLNSINTWDRFYKILQTPLAYQALLRWRTLGLFSQSELESSLLRTESVAFLKWTLTSNETMEELLLTIEEEDKAEEVLNFLAAVWSMDEDAYKKHFSLAMACAVVFDETLQIQHILGDNSEEVDPFINPAERFQWYVDNRNRLETNPKRMRATDLIWVVCAPVQTSELDWALDEMKLRQRNWGQAYGMVRYLMERAVEGENPYEEYSLEEILDEGGICGDQTYFTVNSARANGIPAISLSGNTQSGPHAWAAVQVDDREWTTSVGRIEGSSKGQGRNPQTRKLITEQEIQFWNERSYQSDSITLEVHRLLWLSDLFKVWEMDAERASAISIANRKGRAFPETWEAQFELLQDQTKMTGDPEKPSNLNAWKDFAKAMRREFEENPRMASLANVAEMEYVFPYGSADEAKRAFARERRRIEKESGEQVDLIADSLKREAQLMTQRGDENAQDKIMKLYRSALRDYGQDATAFSLLSDEYFSFSAGDKRMAEKIANDIESSYKRYIETNTDEYFRVKLEVSLLRKVAGFHEKAGNARRADTVLRRAERRMERAVRRNS